MLLQRGKICAEHHPGLSDVMASASISSAKSRRDTDAILQLVLSTHARPGPFRWDGMGCSVLATQGFNLAKIAATKTLRTHVFRNNITFRSRELANGMDGT